MPLGHLAIDLRAREQARGRMLLLGVGASIVLSASPVFGHHVATRADAMLAGHDHVLNLCLIALHHLLAPVHAASHALLIAGFGYALSDRARAALALSRTLRALKSRRSQLGEPIARAAMRVGLEPSRLRIVRGLPNPAFTAGFWHPRVYVTDSLPTVLDAAQLDSVLAHELAHVRRRDPLRLSLLRFLACTLFYLPALRRLADDLTDEAEIDADDRAASRGSALTLASAIVALAEWGATHRALSMSPAAVGFQTFQRVDLLERRVRRLAGEDAPGGDACDAALARCRGRGPGRGVRVGGADGASTAGRGGWHRCEAFTQPAALPPFRRVRDQPSVLPRLAGPTSQRALSARWSVVGRSSPDAPCRGMAFRRLVGVLYAA